MKKTFLLSILALLTASPVLSLEDTIGRVTKVMVKPSTAPGKTVVRVYLTPVPGGNDRHGCISGTGASNLGYIESSDNNPGMNTTSLNYFLSVALAAKATGATFAADHESVPNQTCNNASWAYIFD